MKIASDILRETKMDPSQPWGPPLVGLAFCCLELPPPFFPSFFPRRVFYIYFLLYYYFFGCAAWHEGF